MTHLGVYKDRFADSGLRVFERAINESQLRQQNYVTVGHIVKALEAEDTISFVQLMRDLGGHTLISEELIESVVESGPAWTGRGVRLATDVIRLLKRAMMLARAAGREKIESRDFFLAFERCNRSWAIFLRISPTHSLAVRE